MGHFNQRTIGIKWFSLALAITCSSSDCVMHNERYNCLANIRLKSCPCAAQYRKQKILTHWFSRAFGQRLIFWALWRFSAWKWANLARNPIYSKMHLQHDSRHAFLSTSTMFYDIFAWAYPCQFWSKVMMSEVKQRSTLVTAGPGVNGLSSLLIKLSLEKFHKRCMWCHVQQVFFESGWMESLKIGVMSWKSLWIFSSEKCKPWSLPSCHVFEQ